MEGDASRLGSVVARANAKRVLLFSGGVSYESSGAAAAIAPALHGLEVERISSVTPNPTLEDDEVGVEGSVPGDRRLDFLDRHDQASVW